MWWGKYITLQCHHTETQYKLTTKQPNFIKVMAKVVAISSAVFHPNKPQNILLPQWHFFSFFFSSLVFITNWRSFALISCCFAVRYATVPWHIWATLSFSLKIRQLHVVPFRELIPQYAVRKVNYAIHLIYLQPMDSAIDFPCTYPLDSDLSDGERYPTFEQPGSITISVKNSLILKTSQISNYAVALTQK